jgi:hypothetical protein
MATSARKTARPATKAAAKTPATVHPKPTAAIKRSTAPATTEPCLRFRYSKALRAKTQAMLAALEASPDDVKHRDAVADLVAELTEVGMDYYYLRALRLAQVGFVAEQSARLGMSGATRIISSVCRKFIERMDKEQLLIVARHLRELE